MAQKQWEYVSLSPSTMLNPTPVVLVSCADKNHPEHRNMVTVAWAGWKQGAICWKAVRNAGS